ncbi:MAG: hypothetical protein ACYSW1_13565, partial [Planctomycetota bacterium]
VPTPGSLAERASNPSPTVACGRLQTLAAELYASEQPQDPDVPELLARRRESDSVYLQWGRDTLNWAIYLFKAPPARGARATAAE